MSPERIDPGRTDHTITTTPKVVGGLTPACLERALDVYRACVEHLVPVSSCEAAELTKLLENIFRSVNIALVNELAMLCDRMSLTCGRSSRPPRTKPYGFMPFQPGPGLGGHCLPIDPFYLAWKARELDFPTEFIELAGQGEPAHALLLRRARAPAPNEPPEACGRELGARARRRLQGRRRRPARVAGAEADRAPARPRRGRRLPRPVRPRLGRGAPRHWSRSPLTDELLGEADIVCVVTAHSGIDYARVADRAQLVLDLRNAVPADSAIGS